MDLRSIWLPALTGGLAGAILTFLAQRLHAWWARPILKVVFDDEESGCCVETDAWSQSQTGQLVFSAKERYLRPKIKNEGRGYARNVAVSVTRLTIDVSGVGKTINEEEVFDLHLALTPGNITVFNLAANGHRFVDLVRTSQTPGTPPQLSFDFVNVPLRLIAQGFSKGKYEVTIFVAAENAQSVSQTLRWSWDGTLNGLQI